jgi:hypothetical protein
LGETASFPWRFFESGLHHRPPPLHVGELARRRVEARRGPRPHNWSMPRRGTSVRLGRRDGAAKLNCGARARRTTRSGPRKSGSPYSPVPTNPAAVMRSRTLQELREGARATVFASSVEGALVGAAVLAGPRRRGSARRSRRASSSASPRELPGARRRGLLCPAVAELACAATRELARAGHREGPPVLCAASPLAGLLTVKIRQPSNEFTFGVGMSFIPYPLVLTPVV